MRDSIGTLSDILNETKITYEELLQTMDTVSSDTMINSTHGDVLKDLHEKLTERRQVFVKRSTELARKQAWYRSVALGKHRRDLLCWMLNAVVQTLKVWDKKIIFRQFLSFNNVKIVLIHRNHQMKEIYLHLCPNFM